MTNDADGALVLVTGGSGFLGSWSAVDLLKRAYRVRATVRDLAKADGVRAMIAQEVDAGDRLSFVAADLLKDDGWDAAVERADYVLHVASPMPAGEFRGQDVVTPAREGVRRVLGAAIRAGVKRVVMTSSVEPAKPKSKTGRIDETVWADYPDKPAYNYPRSKVLAERDAWELVGASDGATELVTVLPAFIQGPVLGADFSASVAMVAMMLRGKMPVMPRLGLTIVDIRDIADLHVRAMTAPAAAGERFIGGGDFLWLSDIARILRDNLGDAGKKAPTRTIPDLVVRLGALFNAEMAQVAPNLGTKRPLSAAKAERLLGWKTRPAEESILDGAHSLLSRGLV